jgi:hypothetical protein
MRYLILFFLLPLVAFAQMENDNWSSPVADVKFSNGKIIYTFSENESPGFYRIRPTSYNKNLLELRPVYLPGSLDGESMLLLLDQLNDYLEHWYPGTANNRDKHIFLEQCVIRIIIESHLKLSETTMEALLWLKDDLSVEVSENARLVLQLYDYFNKSNMQF